VFSGRRGHTASVATGVQTHCDRCNSKLVPNAAYCEVCGERTRRARRIVRLAVRIELLFLFLVALLIISFTWIFYAQKP
jgi:predicted nucleic acid-binding Zn ribbon protein